MDESLVVMVHCRRCGRDAAAHEIHTHLCDECVKAEDNRVQFYRQHNFNWMDVAKEADINLWERQPAETDREWQIWLCFRDAWPAVKPSYRLVAETVGTTINVVRKIGQRWNFVARMQAWAKNCDDLTMAQRQNEILDMNKTHISMASVLRDKLNTAINLINPNSLEPKDIQGLFKLSVDIERKARLDEVIVVNAPKFDDENPALKKSPTATNDLSEILQILGKAGVLQPGALGIRQTQTTTTTTEVVAKAVDDE